MTALPSFPPESRVAVIGASGGIGRAFVQLLDADSRVSTVYAFSRADCDIALPKLIPGHIDLDDEDSVEAAAAAAAADGRLDIVLVASGLLADGDELRPEKAMRELQSDNLLRLFAVNAVGPSLVAKHFLPKLNKRTKTVFAALSARVGSISDNRLGGWHSYRASKAALNMLLRTLAIEHARQWPKSIVAGLHPGTVDTALSRPFTSRTPDSQLFSPDRSARYLVNVINELEPDDTGHTFAWDGARIDF